MMASQTIFDRIGGRDAVEAVVSDFYDRVLDDPLLEPYFADTDTEQLHSHQVQFISAVTGGPVEYSGDDMEGAHAGMGITEAAFDAVAAHLEAALRANDVRDADVEAILDDVAAMEDDIVAA